MPVTGDRAAPTDPLPPEARNRLAGLLLLGAGATLLIVSLFLDWFEPGSSAWTVFEVWDIVLAALALVALAAVAGALNVWTPRPDTWLLAPAVVAVVVVVVSLVNHPPAAQSVREDPMVGIWLALAGSLLMLIGATITVARISLAVNLGEPAAGMPQAGAGRRERFVRAPGEAPVETGAPVSAEPTSPTRRVVP